MWLLLGATWALAPNYTRITVPAFLENVWKSGGAEGPNANATEYFERKGLTYYVQRTAGEVPTGWNTTFYYVYGTKEEIAALKATADPVIDANMSIADATTKGTVLFVIFKEVSSLDQLSIFWINVVAWLIILAALLTGFTLWAKDDYAKNPANSLLFVTDGNRIATGE